MTEAETEEKYELRQQRQIEHIQNVDPGWLESDSVPQSLQFMIDILPTIRRLIQGWPIWRILRVLDVGAANGAGSNLLATMHHEYFFNVKMSVDALDIEPRFKPYADQHFHNIKYLVADIYKFDKNDTWDLIICSHTLEHIPDYQKFIHELQKRARYWVLFYVPYEETNPISIHVNSFSEDTIKNLDPIVSQVIESPGWMAFKKDEVRKCILFVMKGFAYGESIIPSAQDQKKIERIEKMVRDEKEYDAAIIEIEDLLKKLPSHPRLNYLLAFCLQSKVTNTDRQGLDDVIKHYDLALKYGHEQFWVKFHRGKLYLKLGELEKAGSDLEQAIKIKPSDEATEAALKEIENLETKRRLERIEKMVRDEKEYDAAIIEIEDLLKKLPSHPRLNYLLAFCLQSKVTNTNNNQRLDDVIKHYDLALKYGYDEFWVKFHRGKLYLKLGELEKAGSDLEQAIKIKPSDEATEAALKEIENLQTKRRLERIEKMVRDEKEYDAAIIEIEDLLKKLPSHPRLNYLLAFCLQSKVTNTNNNQRLDDVIKHYDLALKYGYDEFWVKFHRGKLYLKLGELEKAGSDLEQAIKIKPSDEATEAALKEIENLQTKRRLERIEKMVRDEKDEKEYDAAIIEIEDLLKKLPSHPRLNYLLAFCLQSKVTNTNNNQRLDDVIKHYDLALKYGYDEFWVKFHRGKLYLKLGELEKAGSDLEQAIKIKPSDEATEAALKEIENLQTKRRLERIEKMVRDEKEYDAAIIEIEDLLKKLPSHPRLNYLLAFCLQSKVTNTNNNQRLDDVIKHYDLALKYGYDEFWVKFHRGKLYLKLGELEKAGSDLEQAIKIKPSDEATEAALKEIENLQTKRRLERIEKMVLDEKEYDAAIIEIEDLLKKLPSHPRLNYLLAFCLQSKVTNTNNNQRLDDVIKHYDLALKYGHEQFWVKYGYDEFWVKFHRGKLYLKLGELEKAGSDLEQAIKIKPSDEATEAALKEIENLQTKRRLERIEKMVLDEKEYDAAIIEIEDLLKKLPSHPRLNYLLAFCLQSKVTNTDRQGLDDVIKHYDLALKYGYDEFWVKFHRGKLYLKLGELEKAGSDLEQAIKIKPSDEATEAALKEIENLETKRRLENEIQVLVSINRDKNTELKSCIKDIEVLQNINISYEKTIAVNQNRIRQLKDIEMLRNFNVGYEKTIAVNQNRIMQLDESNKALDTQIRNLNAMINATNQSFISSYEKTIAVNQNRIMQLDESNKALDTQIRNLNAMINATNQSFISSYEKTIAVNQNRIMQLDESNKALDTQIRNLNAMINATNQSFISSYEKTIAVNQNRIMQLDESNKALDTQIRNLNAMINATNQSFTWRLIRRYNAIIYKS